MKKYTSAPLPFQGQKRQLLTYFTEALQRGPLLRQPSPGGGVKGEADGDAQCGGGYRDQMYVKIL